ncbi:MAG: ABC transporter permease [Bacteroidota bacterium]
MRKYGVPVFIAVVLILPFLYLPALSVASTWKYPLLLPASWSPEHWERLFGAHQGVVPVVIHSVLLSGSVALLTTGTGFFLGRLLSGDAGHRQIQAVGYLTYAFSPVIYAYCLQFFFLKTGMSGTVPGVIIVQFLLFFPFSVIYFISHWGRNMKALEELCFTLGASRRDAWILALLPVSASAIRTAFFQIFVFSWFDFGLTRVIGQGRVSTLSLTVWQYLAEADPHLAAAGSCLLLLPPAILMLINEKTIRFKP